MTVFTALSLVLLAMPLVFILLVRFYKRPLAVFHRALTNRIARRFAARLPGFAIVTNFGRKSGKLYRTPVNVFRERDRFFIALTYGQESDWVANVLTSGGCELETRGKSYPLFAPLVVHDPTRKRFPPVVRVVLGLIRANAYLELQLQEGQAVDRVSHG